MTEPTSGPSWVDRTDEEQIEALNHRVVELLRERDEWKSLAVRLAKVHEPYVPMFPSDESRRRTISGSLLDEIYAKAKASANE